MRFSFRPVQAIGIVSVRQNLVFGHPVKSVLTARMAVGRSSNRE